MKKSEIKAGEKYVATISGSKTVVQVEEIMKREGTQYRNAGTYYVVTNLKTGRVVNFKSAQRFLRVATQGAINVLLPKPTPKKVPKVDPIHHRKTASGSTTAPHLVIEARAGTGKTTTLVEGLKMMKGEGSPFTPSPQQAIIWDSMKESQGASRITFSAFNRSIKAELAKRVPAGCEAVTTHSLGLSIITGALGRMEIEPDRVSNLLVKITGMDMFTLRRRKFEVMVAVKKIVGLCKMNLVGGVIGDFEGFSVSSEALDELVSYYDIELNGNRREVYTLVNDVLFDCLKVENDRTIDYDDMIWIPIIRDLSASPRDMLLVDEAQDLNRCQQALARKVVKGGGRLVFCGDPKQAIYGFAGADSESMPRMIDELKGTTRGVEHLWLTVTRRCAKAIVREAQQYVPDFEAHEGNPEGEVLRMKVAGEDHPSKQVDQTCQECGEKVKRVDDTVMCSCGMERLSYRAFVGSGDMIISRVNAPLVSECFKFLRAGKKANIQGRDIGKGLISTIKKVKASGIKDLYQKLEEWEDGQVKKEEAKKTPNENRIQAIHDRVDCIKCFMEESETIDQLIGKINQIFTDDSDGGILLSSIHKAKGLEANRVFFLRTVDAPCPHPMAKTKWAQEQEKNLCYVAITRAINTLVHVS
jgi:hypothetical protein